MKINRIELKNFRCFQHSEIDLSADVTAIYGRNGVGKTTIFDALEFALLGSIGRFLHELDRPYYLPHVLSDNDGMIHVDFRNDSEHWIQLNVNRRNFDNDIESSGNWRNHRDLLYEFFVNQDYFPPRRDVSTVSELFRSTVLLSQDSIREFIEGDVAKRSRILSYISGSGYIQRCFDKAKAVIEEAKKREKQQQVILGEATRMLTETKAKVAEHDAKLIEIRKRSGEVSITHNIVLKALEDAGISISKVIPQTHEDAEIFSASIKGTTNERIAILEERTKLLSQIDAISQQHPDRLIRHRELYEMVEQAKKDLVTLLKKENVITENLKNLDALISEKKLNISENSRNFESLQTLYGFQQQWTDLLNTKAKISDKINQIKQELDSARNRIEKNQGKRDTAKKDVENSITIIEKTSADLEKLKALKIVLPTHIASVDKIKQLESLIIDLSQKRSYLQEHAVKLQGQSRKLTDEMDILKRKISPMKASLEEATNLITRLKEYVTGSVCPLCGHVHPSEKALQEAIDIKIKDIPFDFQEAGKEFQNLSDTLARVNAELEAYTKEIKQVDDDLVKAKSEREEIILLVSKIETNAAAQDIPLIPEELDFSIIKCQKILTELHKNRHQFDEQLNKAEAQLKDTKGIIQSLEAVLTDHTGSYKVCQDKLDDLERHFIELGMSNECKLPADQISNLVESARIKLADLNKWKTEQETFRAKAQSEWNDCRTERIKIESSLKEWEQTLGRLTAEIDDFRFKCKTLNLPLDASPDVIQEAKARLVHEKNSLHLAKQIVERYEWFLKATALEIERKNLDRVIVEVKQTVNNTNEEIAKLHEATKETERWISKLSESVNVAIKAKIDAHEPEIMRLFKNMIPCPYLFEKITMKSNEDRLELGLRYRGQKEDAGEPRFFLSSAQANVLALSIFLSFATEQNWSKLETILLDDPVQHLDDLDAVAFLDNLRAIALGKFGRRKQIVVSTCDKNLYLLMMRKFDLLATDDLKFTGISLLDKGFGGPEIIYDIGGPQNRQLHLRAV